MCSENFHQQFEQSELQLVQGRGLIKIYWRAYMFYFYLYICVGPIYCAFFHLCKMILRLLLFLFFGFVFINVQFAERLH